MCVVSGADENLVAAHIISLESCELIDRGKEFSVVNGILLRKDLENDYDFHMWIFSETGDIQVLNQKWLHRNTFKTVKLNSTAKYPSVDSEMIRIHNEIALSKIKHHCPQCWKYVGEANITSHQKSSCEAIDLSDDDEIA